MSFADEINRLFDELVHVPWSTPRKTHAGRPPEREIQLEFEMPVAQQQLGDMSVSLQGRQLLIRAGGRRAGASEGGPALERSFILPESAEVSGIEARIEDARLHVRVRLRTVG